MHQLNFIQFENVSILKQLRLEEALLRTDQENWCIVNTGSPPAIVLGISGKVEKLIHPKFLDERPFPLIRRFSGGGTVVIDPSTLFITWICNKTVLTSAFPECVMKWSENLYRPLFAHLSFQARENDYVIENRKFGGNAQYFCKERWLHHTSFLWDYHDPYMDYLLMPEKTPQYREKRRHTEFLCKLKDYFDCQKQFILNFKEELAKNFRLACYPMEDIPKILERPHRKSVVEL